MNRSIVRKTTLKEQGEAFCLSLSVNERIRVLEELNRIGRAALHYEERPLDRTVVRIRRLHEE